MNQHGTVKSTVLFYLFAIFAPRLIMRAVACKPDGALSLTILTDSTSMKTKLQKKLNFIWNYPKNINMLYEYYC